MTDKRHIKEWLELQMKHLALEQEKCKHLLNHLDEYDFYEVPTVEPHDIHVTKH